jgi:hypothetical protein
LLSHGCFSCIFTELQGFFDNTYDDGSNPVMRVYSVLYAFPDEDEGDNRFELESVSDDEQDEADLGTPRCCCWLHLLCPVRRWVESESVVREG